MTSKGSVDTLGVLGHWTASGDILVGYVTFNDRGLPSLFARCNNLKDAETVAAALNDHRGAVEALRAVWDDMRSTDKHFVSNEVLAQVRAVIGSELDEHDPAFAARGQ